MKTPTCLLGVAIIMLVSACQKNGVAVISQSSLIGKWKLDANFYGTGSAPTWYPVAKDDNHTVQFNADGTLGGNEYSQYYGYKVKDSLLTLNSTADAELRLLYAIKHDTLIVSPASVSCYEGCAVRFVKQK
ncbi:hypothetical protein [Mucilaginibacter sp.]|uniref:hypothetical protein n=1 Tax=Mucilaginibacter sp. TaxID=1882438 RepID=UPI00263586F6|nr:hypothetical protein [Mucilaginibacter sp.]MDB4924986.1 hypothetical protein [Mucilaginibacter sp.]